MSHTQWLTRIQIQMVCRYRQSLSRGSRSILVVAHNLGVRLLYGQCSASSPRGRSVMMSSLLETYVRVSEGRVVAAANTIAGAPHSRHTFNCFAVSLVVE